MSITIGPAHIADANGTHDPGTVVEDPTDALIALADEKTCDPATGLPYAVHTPATAEPEATPEATPAGSAAPIPEPAPAPEPVVEPIPEPTPPAEEAA